MRGRSGLLHNLGILTVGQIVSQIANVAALVYLADFLGPHRFGVVQLGVAFMAYALIIAEWGMMSLGIREVSRLDEPARIFAYCREHCGIMAVQAVVVLALGLVVLPHLPFYAHDHVVFLLYLAAVIPQVYTQDWVAVGLERMKWVGASRIVRSLTYALLIFTTLRFLDGDQQAQRWVPATFLLATVLGNLTVNIPLAHWFGRFVHPRLPSWSACRERWTQTSSIGANVVILRILYNIDLMMLGILASPEAAGNYAAAAKIMFVLVVAVEMLWTALLPRLSRLAKRAPADFRKTFNLFFGTVTALLLPISLGGWLVGTDLIDFLYRGKFTAAGPIFQVLAVSYSMLALGTFLGNTLLAEDRQKWYLLPLIVSSLTAIAAVRLLVPEYGNLGAAWGIFIAHALLLIILTVINIRDFTRRLGEVLLGILPALAAMGLVLTLFPRWHVLVRIIIGGLVYLILAAYPLLRLRRLSAAGSDVEPE